MSYALLANSSKEELGVAAKMTLIREGSLSRNVCFNKLSATGPRGDDCPSRPRISKRSSVGRFKSCPRSMAGSDKSLFSLKVSLASKVFSMACLRN